MLMPSSPAFHRETSLPATVPGRFLINAAPARGRDALQARLKGLFQIRRKYGPRIHGVRFRRRAFGV